MIKNRKLKIVRNIVFYLLLIVSIHLINGCSGCSHSGRRSHQKSSSNNYSSNTTNSQSQNKNESHKNSNNKEALPLSELYNKYKKSVFLIYTSDGNNEFQGSGFFISKSGLAVSNYHVFEGTSQGLETIETFEGKQFKIEKVLEKNKKKDYIVFRVNISNYNILHPIPLVSETPQIGEDVFAIGNPRGLESTLSKGIISGYRENDKLIQTTTEITHGSSGGPLLNMKGEVVGITTSGLGEANINFAVNINHLPLYKFL